MAGKSWRLDRRTLLLGTGVSLALPWMECMGSGAEEQSATFIKLRRFCAMYFGFGVGLPQENSDQAA